MPEFEATIKRLGKDKRVVIGAAAVGGVAALYVLSHNGGSGLPSLQNPAAVTPDQASQAGQSGDSSSNADVAALANELAQQQSGLASFQAQVTQALASLVDQFNQALGGVSNQSQQGLSALAAQTNQALSGLAESQVVPDFSGFESQLYSNLNSALAEIQRQIPSGQVQQYMSPSVNLPPVTGTLGGKAPLASIGFNIGAALGSIIKPFVSQTPAQSVQTALPSKAFNLTDFAASFNKLIGTSTAKPITPTTPILANTAYNVGQQLGNILNQFSGYSTGGSGGGSRGFG